MERVEKRGDTGSGPENARSAPEQVMVGFGQDDPLLPEFRQILAHTIKVSKVVSSPHGDWISAAGHYPMEQKPELIAQSIDFFLKRQ